MKKYEMIYNDLRQSIIMGHYQAKDKLPSEEELAKKYNTSRVPVQQALNALVGQSMVKRIAGSGTYVTYESTLDIRSNRDTVLLLYHMDEESNRILEGVQNVLRAQGMFVTARFSQFDPTLLNRTLTELEKRTIAGAIVYAQTTNEWFSYYPALMEKLPLVFIDQPPNKLLCNCVMSDPQQGMNQLVQHLVDNGHEKIGFVGFPLKDSFAMKYRFHMVQMALEYNGLHLDKRYTSFDFFKRDTYHDSLRRLLTMEDPPTALIFGMADMYRLSLQVFDELGIRIPEDMSVVAYDRLTDLEENNRQVTHVNQDYYGIGVKAASRLFDIMVNPNQGYVMDYLPVDFHDRGSVKKLDAAQAGGSVIQLA